MDSFLFLAVGAGVVVLAAMRESKKTQGWLQKHSGKVNALPKAISVLILTAQLSELLKMIANISVVNVVASLFLLAILAAAKSGTEGEWL
jgi:hypothetical protein